MELLHQIFMTVVAAFVFVILIAKLASAVINGDDDDHQSRRIHDFSKEKFKPDIEKSSSKSKSTKKVRFAVDHEEFVVNKVVAEPSETKPVVFEKNQGEVTGEIEKVDSLVVEDDHENGTADCEDNKTKEKSESDGVIDFDQTLDGKRELVEHRSSEGTINVANVDENQNQDQMCMKLLCDDGIDEEDEKQKVGLISDEDDSDSDSDSDWEGVERSDLQKVFAMAADYIKDDDHLQSIDNDIQMQLYGLHKVATEGPCHEAQPMPLKLAARAKWNAWQKLGNMNPDMAMEQYISLLSEMVPGWSNEVHSVGIDSSSSSITSTLIGVAEDKQ